MIHLYNKLDEDESSWIYELKNIKEKPSCLLETMIEAERKKGVEDGK